MRCARLQHRKAAPLHGSSDETLPSTTRLCQMTRLADAERVRLFCFLVPVVPTAEIPTLPVISQTLFNCDGHAILSWYADTKWNVTRAFSRGIVRPKPYAVPPALASWSRIAADESLRTSFDWCECMPLCLEGRC